LAKGDFIVPIPGTKRQNYLEENVGALAVHLTAGELARVDEALPPGSASGPRYPEASMRFLNN
jgi:aryl-alcohol dehydrogenase-like predicted oxidoreductase